MPYNVIATNGRLSMMGDTTAAMWALLKAGQDVGRDFTGPFWDELVRGTIFESAQWSGHGTTERSHGTAVRPLTREWKVLAV